MNDERPNEKNKNAQARADLLANYLRTFECDAGKSVLAHLHATAGSKLSSFHPGDGFNATAAAKRDGGKTLVWGIEAILEQARAASRTTDPGDKPKTVGGRSARRKVP